MTHLNNYINQFTATSKVLASSIERSANTVWNHYLSTFSYTEHLNGLIFGQVQSGKTGHLLGIAAKAADEGFNIFVLLTLDNVNLQQQTFARALSVLDSFNVCGESDDLRFRQGGLRKPLLIILKKNQSVLSTWRDHLATTDFVRTQPLFVLDDEGDAASLNTAINIDRHSRINSLLQEIRHLAPSSILLSVTATPQALALQADDSSMRPRFAYYVEPGSGYLGGNFFYSENSFCPRQIEEGELGNLLNRNRIAPEGLRKSILSFLVTSAHMRLNDLPVTNLLIHPSTRISDHSIVRTKIQSFLSDIEYDLSAGSATLQATIFDIWQGGLVNRCVNIRHRQVLPPV